MENTVINRKWKERDVKRRVIKQKRKGVGVKTRR